MVVIYSNLFQFVNTVVIVLERNGERKVYHVDASQT